jgi:hypothetical protein
VSIKITGLNCSEFPDDNNSLIRSPCTPQVCLTGVLDTTLYDQVCLTGVLDTTLYDQVCLTGVLDTTLYDQVCH